MALGQWASATAQNQTRPQAHTVQSH